jgi:hypothetical protein
MNQEPRSALVLLIPEAEPAVARLRLAHDPAARAGMPAHVTLLFPFRRPRDLQEATLALLAAQFGRFGAPLALIFDRVARFPGVAYLAPVDPAPVSALVRALAIAWPEYPPYEGRFAEIVPHLTVAHGPPALLAESDRELGAHLPIVARLRSATLMVEDDDGRWRERARFTLGPAPRSALEG